MSTKNCKRKYCESLVIVNKRVNHTQKTREKKKTKEKQRKKIVTSTKWEKKSRGDRR